MKIQEVKLEYYLLLIIIYSYTSARLEHLDWGLLPGIPADFERNLEFFSLSLEIPTCKSCYKLHICFLPKFIEIKEFKCFQTVQ